MMRGLQESMSCWLSPTFFNVIVCDLWMCSCDAVKQLPGPVCPSRAWLGMASQPSGGFSIAKLVFDDPVCSRCQWRRFSVSKIKGNNYRENLLGNEIHLGRKDCVWDSCWKAASHTGGRECKMGRIPSTPEAKVSHQDSPCNTKIGRSRQSSSTACTLPCCSADSWNPVGRARKPPPYREKVPCQTPYSKSVLSKLLLSAKWLHTQGLHATIIHAN